MDGGLYLYGGLTEWQVQPKYRLDYNHRDGMYEGTAYLKQGYYNYQYIYLKDGETEGETALTEGSFFQARQIYTFYVYHAQMGSRYDRLIGHTIITNTFWPNGATGFKNARLFVTTIGYDQAYKRHTD